MEMLCIVGFDGYFKAFSSAWQETLGWSAEELKAKPFLDFVHPQDRDKTRQITLQAKCEIRALPFENRYLCKDGSYRWLVWTSVPRPEEELIYAAAHDVSEHKEVEEVMRQSEARFRTVFESSTIGKCLTGVDGKLLVINDAFCQMLGYARSELMGKNFADLTHPEDLDISRECVRQLLEGERDRYQFEKRYLHKDGHVVCVDVGTYLLRGDKNRPLYFITDIQDISQRKQSEERVLHLNEVIRALRTPRE